jgi:hypothetical protein
VFIARVGGVQWSFFFEPPLRFLREKRLFVFSNFIFLSLSLFARARPARFVFQTPRIDDDDEQKGK